MDKENDKYVWYVAYGSNLYEFRFIKYFDENFTLEQYIKKDSPYFFENKPFKIFHPIYFANRAGCSRKWGNTGVAFLDYKSIGFAFGRAYKISKELFEYLRGKEGTSDNWYNKVVHLGYMDDGIEIVTITNKEKLDYVEPCEAYLNTIKNGLNEIGLTNETADSYLESAMNNNDFGKDKTKTSHIVIKTKLIDTPNGKRLIDIRELLTMSELDSVTFHSLWSIFEERNYQKPEIWMLLKLDPETRSNLITLAIEHKDIPEDEFLDKAFDIIAKNKV